MSRVSGKALISETTEKVLGRTLIVASIAVLTKLYDVPLNDLKALGVELPAALVDSVLLVLVLYYMYSLTVNWLGDLAAFRLWHTESSIWSEFGSNMKLDKSFIRGALPLMLRLHELEKNGEFPATKAGVSDQDRREFNDFKTNAELYALRLEHAGTRFSTLTWFGRYYVWIQSYVFPILWCTFAVYLLLRYGTFTPPIRL
jgi:hypothetical protein